MNLTRGIAAKIFGLALFLLMLVIVLASLMLVEVASSERTTAQTRTFEVPVQDAVIALESESLRRQLAFERIFGALNAPEPNQAVIAEAERNYQIFSLSIDERLATIDRILRNYPVDGRYRREFDKLGVILGELTANYQQVTRHQIELLGMQRQGQRREANERYNLYHEQTLTMRRQRGSMVAIINQIADQDLAEQVARQQQLKKLTIAATVTAVLLGLLVAAAITLRLTRSVRELTEAMQEVRAGRLDARLPAPTSDEIGNLTETFNYFINELRAKEQLRRTFGRYVDPRVMELLLQSGDQMGAGERRGMTIVFADIVGFTELSERLTPTLMVKVLNRHFTLQAQAVQAHGGVVDKFIGDAILAFWGAPFVPDSEQVPRAISAALEMLAATEALNAEMPELTGLRRDPPRISLRVGIATGDVVVGNIGSESACSFTVIGDTVNLASRIEGMNRTYGTNIMMSESTARQVGDDFVLREIDAVAAKGKQESTRVFELMGSSTALSPSQQALREAYLQGLAAYRAGDRAAAEQHFREARASVAGDPPTQLMLERLHNWDNEAPPTGWDGVWRMKSK